MVGIIQPAEVKIAPKPECRRSRWVVTFVNSDDFLVFEDESQRPRRCRSG